MNKVLCPNCFHQGVDVFYSVENTPVNSMIQVSSRTRSGLKEATIMTGGVGKSMPGMHYDLIITMAHIADMNPYDFGKIVDPILQGVYISVSFAYPLKKAKLRGKKYAQHALALWQCIPGEIRAFSNKLDVNHMV